LESAPWITTVPPACTRFSLVTLRLVDLRREDLMQEEYRCIPSPSALLMRIR
jgi:hypothetical protein